MLHSMLQCLVASPSDATVPYSTPPQFSYIYTTLALKQNCPAEARERRQAKPGARPGPGPGPGLRWEFRDREGGRVVCDL